MDRFWNGRIEGHASYSGGRRSTRSQVTLLALLYQVVDEEFVNRNPLTRVLPHGCSCSGSSSASLRFSTSNKREKRTFGITVHGMVQT
ncbi:MAG: hypothetical protein ACYTFG_00235 [Planctomycetota bacterium]